MKFSTLLLLKKQVPLLLGVSLLLASYNVQTVVVADSVQEEDACIEWKDQKGAYEALTAEEKESCVMKKVMATKGQRAV